MNNSLLSLKAYILLLSLNLYLCKETAIYNKTALALNLHKYSSLSAEIPTESLQCADYCQKNLGNLSMPHNVFSMNLGASENNNTETEIYNLDEKGERNKSEEYGDRRDIIRLPRVNFYRTAAMAIGIIGNGWLWLREVSNSIGTPLPLWIGHILIVTVAFGALFLPNLRALGLPLFYADFPAPMRQPTVATPVEIPVLSDLLDFSAGDLMTMSWEFLKNPTKIFGSTIVFEK